ncbi:hypothetical protein [Paenibacillus sp. FSL E2-0177]|uniref:hypothetical protein n=1 Tax=Paenibacillus sp. FSL E2-0177 TaxID=2921360 RepID=UPI0030EB6C13
MSYINFKGTVKKINLKSAEETEITISIPASELDGQYNTLQSMLELKVIGGLDSQIVTYKVMKNAKTGTPITRYKVDSGGVVFVAQPEGEQLTMDLGLPAEQIEVKADPEQIDLEVIQDFILSGLAPQFEDMDYDFLEITERLAEGETYLKIASDVNMGVGIFVVMVDEYRKRVAPMAAEWDKWRKGQVKAEPVVDKGTVGGEGEEPETVEEDTQEGGEESAGSSKGDEPDEQTQSLEVAGDGVGAENDKEDAPSVENVTEGTQDKNSGSEGDGNLEEVSKEALEAFILTNRPVYDDIEIDGTPILFPELLQERIELKKTWKEIAQEKGISPSVLSTKYGTYKKRVEKKMKDSRGAA